LDLFNELAEQYQDPRLVLLIQLSVLKDHPWNAKFIDQFLNKLGMPERDAYWSVEIANITGEEEHPLHRLIDWVFRADKTAAEDETLSLVALVLTWCFTTSSRPIRDRATKALVKVFIERPRLFPDLLHRFASIDDLYVLERLCAAGFGAVCHGMEDETLSAIAGAVFEEIFKEGSPPPHLLMRDYARGIVDLAGERGCVPASVDISLCHPPYKSPWPIPEVTEDEIDKVRETAGDDSIYYSAFTFGDFERYEIDPLISEFTSVSLTEDRPLSEDEKLEKLRGLIENWTKNKQNAFVRLEDAVERFKDSIRISFDDEKPQFSIKRDESVAEEVDHAEGQLVALLSYSEKKFYQELVVPSFFPDRVPKEELGIPRFPVQLAKSWITKRAYDFGWTKKLFPNELGHWVDRQRPSVERIGKKYQWLALSELMARLTDNVWLSERWREKAYRYDHACQTSFVRYIEPTILESPKDPIKADKYDQWWFPRKITFQPESDEMVARWPFEDRDFINNADLIDVQDGDGHDWLALSSFYSADERFVNSDVLLSFRRSAFVRVSSIIVRTEDAQRIINTLKNKRLTDPTDWEPAEITDGPYYLEFPWRNTWSGICDDWVNDDLGVLKDFSYIQPVMSHFWESHLDKALPNGSHVCIPSIWLAKKLRLKPRSFHFGQFEDNTERLVFFDPSVGTELFSAGLVDRKIFLDFLEANRLECLWIIAGDKHANPSGSRDTQGRRWHSAIYRWTGKKLEQFLWHKDDHQGLEKYLK